MAEPDASAGNAPEFSVSDLSNAIKRSLEDQFGYVRVRGEISGYRGPHSSGHAYFCLKDAGARLDAVVWRSAFLRMKVRPEEGLEVVATGRLTAYPGKSSYQIVIERLELAGVGALMALLEARRKKLAAEGLFDTTRKRKIPFMPRVVGVVTSPTGAVIRDILHRLTDRFPVRVLVWPVRVQGETSAAEVAAAIEGFNALAPGGGPAPRPDVLIVARGGGSLEDLMGFNEEVSVRAVAASAIPVIAAVGHETDWTLIDHAADLRAPTPTAAAEFAVPVRGELLDAVAALDGRLRGATRRLADRRRSDFRALARALPSAESLVEGPRQRLDRAAEALAARMRGAVGARALRLSGLARGLARHSPRAHLAGLGERLRGIAGRLGRLGPILVERPRREAEAAGRALLREGGRLAQRRADRADHLQAVGARLDRAFAESLAARRARLSGVWQLASAVSYRAVLARGFALVRDERDQPLRSAAEAREGQRLAIEFADGVITATAGHARVEAPSRPAFAPPPRTRRPRGAGDEGQGSLF